MMNTRKFPNNICILVKITTYVSVLLLNTLFRRGVKTHETYETGALIQFRNDLKWT